jgi:HEPN domain-containing protein
MRNEVRAWREQAIADFHTAEANFKEKRYYALVFFCEQAVEKALKVYVLKKIRNAQNMTETTIHTEAVRRAVG